MRLNNANAEIYCPDGAPGAQALARTTHMGISAHQDDLQIMAGDEVTALVKATSVMVLK